MAWRRRAAAGPGAWQPLPGVEFRAADGLLQIRAPQLATAEWFHSADRVVMSGGSFELAGRSDRIVKLEEKRVSLDAVERVLLASGLVRQARALVLDETRPALAVIAMPEEAGWQLAGEGKPKLVAALTESLRHSAEAEVLPRAWRFVDPWPVTADGKSPEALLRARFDRRVPEFRVLERSAGVACWSCGFRRPRRISPGIFPDSRCCRAWRRSSGLVWLARELLGADGGFAGLDAAKFKRIIRPGSTLRVELLRDAARNATSYQVHIGAELCASGRIRWGST